MREIALLAAEACEREGARIEGQDETLQRERDAAQRAVVDHQQREQERRDEISALRRQIEEAQQAHEAAMNTLRERLDESAQRNAAAKALEADEGAPAQRLDEQAVDQIERQAQEHRQQIAEYRSDLEARQRHIESIEEDLGRLFDETINELGSTVAGLETALEQTQAQAHDWKERCASVEGKAEGLLADVERLRGQLDGQGDGGAGAWNTSESRSGQ